jgi:FMN phosphatase YigB (HAD superfamily)
MLKEIIRKHDLAEDEILVVGDDEDSEIKFAKQLGLDALLYDRQSEREDSITNFRSLPKYFY